MKKFHMTLLVFIFAAGVMLSAGCGQKGPLRLPATAVNSLFDTKVLPSQASAIQSMQGLVS